jgi:Arc/MetJ-type ribon-helix-helix transcriptional regulator
MTLSLKPELEEWIQSEIAAGHYPSAEAVVEAALRDQMSIVMDDTLDEDDLAAIAEADAESDRGEGMTLEEFQVEMAERIRTCKR